MPVSRSSLTVEHVIIGKKSTTEVFFLFHSFSFPSLSRYVVTFGGWRGGGRGKVKMGVTIQIVVIVSCAPFVACSCFC